MFSYPIILRMCLQIQLKDIVIAVALALMWSLHCDLHKFGQKKKKIITKISINSNMNIYAVHIVNCNVTYNIGVRAMKIFQFMNQWYGSSE